MSRSRGPDDGCSIRIRRKFGSFGNQFGELRKFGRRALRTYVRSGEMGSLRGSAAARTLLQADKNEPPTVVGVNINIPIPVISDLLGSETPHKDRYVRVFSHRTDRSAPHPIPSPYTLTLYPHPIPSPYTLTRPSSVSLGRSWWFWIIIAIIACFFIVAVWFTVRGWRRYRHVYRPRLAERAPSGALSRRTAGGALSQPGAHAPVGMQDAWKMKTLVKVNPRYAVDV